MTSGLTATFALKGYEPSAMLFEKGWQHILVSLQCVANCRVVGHEGKTNPSLSKIVGILIVWSPSETKVDSTLLCTKGLAMAMNSTIEWTDHTFNPWTGCTNISPGCDHCYAEAWSKRSGQVKWGNSPRKRTTDSYWRSPHIWQRKAAEFAAAHGRRQRVFCASLADVFDNQADPAWRIDLFKVIRATPSLDWQLLTKRPQNIKKMLPPDWGATGYSNVWLGFTAEDQVRFDQRKRFINEVPAQVWFVSYEPAIGPLRISEADPRPDWLISGGESGPGARPMMCNWVRDIIADCDALGIAAFHKQWGASGNNPLVQEKGISAAEIKDLDPFGKGGGLLDGRLIRHFPAGDKKNVNAA